VILSSLVWVTLNSSFTGKDLLTVQLAAGNGASPINQFISPGFLNTYGNVYTDQTSGDVLIQDLFYSLPLTDAVKLTLGPTVNWFNYFDFNFDFNNSTSYLNGASIYASVASTQSGVKLNIQLPKS
jgi:hypothetical protein